MIITIPGTVETRGRPRKHFRDRAATGTETKRITRANRELDRREHVAVWDTETEPFDKERQRSKENGGLALDDYIIPFVGCLWSRNFEPIIIWEDDYETFVEKWIEVFEGLEGNYTIYAHNGGKFDYMFLIHKMRGRVSFKGRGIMSAKLGRHELRDSFHIIPEKLSAFHKETFDYQKNRKKVRHNFKDEIIAYLISDCEYLYDFVTAFLDRFGFKISIGQAAMSEMKKVYDVGKIGQNTDATLRQWYFGGRVECLAGKGHWTGHYKLYDANSMYPSVMVECEHPISANYERRVKGGPSRATVFIDLTCDSYGAMIKRRQDETGQWETYAAHGRDRFQTTIWEYNAALELGLIDRIQIHAVIDNPVRSNFEKVIVPWYENRLKTKAILSEMSQRGLDEDDAEYLEVKKDDLFWKYLLNNSYGKYAQNPRNYKEHYITDWDSPAPQGFEECGLPKFRTQEGSYPAYAIWEKPAPRHIFNNVGTAASITGAARAKLMRAIAGAVDPIYCDTDSLLCRSIGPTVEIDTKKLGAWKLEAEFSEVIIAGKKLYACKPLDQSKKTKVKSKGASGLDWDDMAALLRGDVIQSVNTGVTITKTGAQFYMTRNIRATAKDQQKNGTIRRLPNRERSRAVA